MLRVALVAALVSSSFVLTAQNPVSSDAAPPGQQTPSSASDQVAKPEAKSSTLIGCLSSGDAEGRYVLNSMQHRNGVQILGSKDELKKAVGRKVQLTGSWAPLPAAPADQLPSASKKPRDRQFQATHVEVLSQNCVPPQSTPPKKN